LNPTKCVFDVPFGKLLGFIVSHRGIEANPEKEAFFSLSCSRNKTNSNGLKKQPMLSKISSSTSSLLPPSRLHCQERNCSYILQPPHTSSARQLWYNAKKKVMPTVSKDQSTS